MFWVCREGLFGRVGGIFCMFVLNWFLTLLRIVVILRSFPNVVITVRRDGNHDSW